MNTEYYKKNIGKFLVGFAIIAMFLIGIFLGRYSNAQSKTPVVDAPTLAQNADLNQFWSVWKLLNDKFPFKEKIPADNDRIYGAISGMVESFGDPYTKFFPPKESKLFSEEVKGEFTGIGMEVGVKDNLMTVIAPLKNSPSEKAGMKAGDYIIKIDDKSTETMSVDEAVSLIRGDKGTTVTLTVARVGESEFIKIPIVRDVIAVPIIDTKKEGDVFIISFYSFSENSAKLFTDALKTFSQSGLKKLVIDMRNNPGGYLESAVDIGSLFIPQGKIIVRENQGDEDPELVYRSHGSDIALPRGLQTLILVNEGSASASEILAGAMSEHGVAKLVGTQTFGKGSVQELIPLNDGSSVKITVAKWFTPNGVSISEKGIKPNTVIDEKPSDKNPDPVLRASLKLFK
jgi:carboxyl-terminal processing protease